MFRLRAPLFSAALVGLLSTPALAASPPQTTAETDSAADPSADAPANPDAETPAPSDDTEPATSDDAKGEPATSEDAPAGEDPGEAADEAPSGDEEPPVDDTTDDPDAATDGDDEVPPALPNPLPPKHRISYNNLTVARLNPLGLVNRFLIDYRYRLYDEPSLLKNGSYIGLGVEAQITPALATVRPQLTISPLAILRLRAGYGLIAHFGNFGLMQGFETPYDEYYTAELDARAPTEAYAAVGSMGLFAALLQAKVKSIAIRNEVQFTYNRADMRGDNKLWYWQTDDMLIEADGWHMVNDSDLLWISKFGLTAGVRNTVTKAFYQDSSFAPGQKKKDPNGATNRVGPLIAYTFYDKPNEKPRFNRPSVLVIAQWWTRHRYRTGGLLDDPYNRESLTVNPETGETEKVGSIGDSLPGMPYLIIGFAFEGDFFQFEKGQTVPIETWKKKRQERRAAKRARK